MGFSITSRGDWHTTENFLHKMSHDNIFASLEKYGQQGVDALAAATPVDTGLTAGSWYYEVVSRKGYWSLRWHNRDIDKTGAPIAILLQYGHGTGTGGYVQGIDYINPVIKPLFDQIEEEARRVVTGNG